MNQFLFPNSLTGRASIIDKTSTNEFAICCEFSEFKPEDLNLWVFCSSGVFGGEGLLSEGCIRFNKGIVVLTKRHQLVVTEIR